MAGADFWRGRGRARGRGWCDREVEARQIGLGVGTCYGDGTVVVGLGARRHLGTGMVVAGSGWGIDGDCAWVGGHGGGVFVKHRRRRVRCSAG
jgi:hypothetical protein